MQDEADEDRNGARLGSAEAGLPAKPNSATTQLLLQSLNSLVRPSLFSTQQLNCPTQQENSDSQAPIMSSSALDTGEPLASPALPCKHM